MQHGDLNFSGNDPVASRRITVLAADDHPIFLDGIASILAVDPEIELVGRATGGVQALDRYRALRPDIVIMDLQMHDMDGIDATRLILGEFPAAKVIMLTMFESDGFVMRALKAGVFA